MSILLSETELKKIKDNKKELIKYAKKLSENRKLDFSDFQEKVNEYLQSKVDQEELSDEEQIELGLAFMYKMLKKYVAVKNDKKIINLFEDEEEKQKKVSIDMFAEEDEKDEKEEIKEKVKPKEVKPKEVKPKEVKPRKKSPSRTSSRTPEAPDTLSKKDKKRYNELAMYPDKSRSGEESLTEMAKEYNLPGRSRMNKQDKILAIIKFENKKKKTRKQSSEEVEVEETKELLDCGEYSKQNLLNKSIGELRNLLNTRYSVNADNVEDVEESVDMICNPVEKCGEDYKCSEGKVCNINTEPGLCVNENINRNLSMLTYKDRTIVGSSKVIEILKNKLTEKEKEKEQEEEEEKKKKPKKNKQKLIDKNFDVSRIKDEKIASRLYKQYKKHKKMCSESNDYDCGKNLYCDISTRPGICIDENSMKKRQYNYDLPLFNKKVYSTVRQQSIEDEQLKLDNEIQQYRETLLEVNEKQDNLNFEERDHEEKTDVDEEDQQKREQKTYVDEEDQQKTYIEEEDEDEEKKELKLPEISSEKIEEKIQELIAGERPKTGLDEKRNKILKCLGLLG